MSSKLCVDKCLYKKSFPKFGKPTIIGYINIENLQYARKISGEKVHFDLNLHINKVIRKPADLDVKLTELLKFLLENEIRLTLPITNELNNAQFFCYRGLMTCVASTPYENRDTWKIVALLYKGNIYLCARDTEDQTYRKTTMKPRDKQMTSWGFKFEQYVLSDSPETLPDPDVPVDETKEFSLVMRSHLNEHIINYGAEMDGIRCDKERISPLDTTDGPEAIIEYLSSKEFIELKTRRHIENQRQDNTFRKFNTRKWWLQSFLVGIDTILCGFRNDDGIVEELRTLNVKDLTKMSKEFWDPNVCFNFLTNFFTFVKKCLAHRIIQKYGESYLNNLQELPLISLLFEWNCGHAVTVSSNYSHDDDPILHEWFLLNFGKHNNEKNDE